MHFVDIARSQIYWCLALRSPKTFTSETMCAQIIRLLAPSTSCTPSKSIHYHFLPARLLAFARLLGHIRHLSPGHGALLASPLNSCTFASCTEKPQFMVSMRHIRARILCTSCSLSYFIHALRSFSSAHPAIMPVVHVLPCAHIHLHFYLYQK